MILKERLFKTKCLKIGPPKVSFFEKRSSVAFLSWEKQNVSSSLVLVVFEALSLTLSLSVFLS